MADTNHVTLADLMVVACAEVWRGNGEVLASGFGIVPRIGAGLAKLTHSPELLMTDSEAFLVEEPIPLGPRNGFQPRYSGYLSFERVFECVWSGKRHVMIGPTQVDRWGQCNLSVVGGSYEKPKSAILGVRGLPGNSINHANSFFVPNHGPRTFVSGDVDMVCGVGYNPARWEVGVKRDFVDLRRIVTDLCVMDFSGPDHAIRVVSLHPGVSFSDVQTATGFALLEAPHLSTTALPTAEQLRVIQHLDPHGLRATVLKGNPPALRGDRKIS